MYIIKYSTFLIFIYKQKQAQKNISLPTVCVNNEIKKSIKKPTTVLLGSREPLNATIRVFRFNNIHYYCFVLFCFFFFFLFR